MSSQRQRNNRTSTSDKHDLVIRIAAYATIVSTAIAVQNMLVDIEPTKEEEIKPEQSIVVEITEPNLIKFTDIQFSLDLIAQNCMQNKLTPTGREFIKLLPPHLSQQDSIPDIDMSYETAHTFYILGQVTSDSTCNSKESLVPHRDTDYLNLYQLLMEEQPLLIIKTYLIALMRTYKIDQETLLSNVKVDSKGLVRRALDFDYEVPES
ncbi:hypothetical protein [Vibrio owensii]|uniref:hypothetical protein n=1 Tax=Vibrio harveyi group TaxID=717610 RepID=UPI003CC53D9B